MAFLIWAAVAAVALSIIKPMVEEIVDSVNEKNDNYPADPEIQNEDNLTDSELENDNTGEPIEPESGNNETDEPIEPETGIESGGMLDLGQGSELVNISESGVLGYQMDQKAHHTEDNVNEPDKSDPIDSYGDHDYSSLTNDSPL